MIRKGKQQKAVSPRVAARLATAFPTVSWDASRGVALLGNTPVAPRILLPSVGARFAVPDNIPWSISLFPIPATEIARSAQRALEQQERQRQRGRELTAEDAARATIARAAQNLANQYPGNTFAALMVLAPVGSRAATEAADLGQGTRVATPATTWPQATTAIIPVSPPSRLPIQEAYFGFVPPFLNPLPTPPIPSPLKGQERMFYLGVSVDGHLVTWSPWATINPHLGITGYSGSGKSALCRLISYQAALQGIPFVVIDPKGEWPAQAPRLVEMGVDVWVTSERDLYTHRLPSPVEVIGMTTGPDPTGPQRAQALSSLLAPLSDAASAVAVRAAAKPDLGWEDVYAAAKELGVAAEFGIFAPDSAWRNLFNPETPAWTLGGNISIFGLAHLTGAAMGDVRNNDFFTLLLLLSLSEALKRLRGAIVLVDEAHILLRLPATRQAVNILLRVARSAGLSVILASQTWDDLYGGDEPLATQCATRVILRPAAEEVARMTEYQSEVEAICAVGRPGAGLLVSPQERTLFSVIVPPVAQQFCFA